MFIRNYFLVFSCFFCIFDAFGMETEDEKENDATQINKGDQQVDYASSLSIGLGKRKRSEAEDFGFQGITIDPKVLLGPQIKEAAKSIRENRPRAVRKRASFHENVNNFSEGAKWQTCFTPEHKCSETLIAEIAKAQESIFVQAYVLSSHEIADALVAAHKRNVEVRVLVDRAQISLDYSKIAFLDDNGVPVYVDVIASLAHNKVVLIDKKIVITGSYNFSNAAEHRNIENFIVIYDPKVAQSYLGSFAGRYEDCYRYKKNDERVTIVPSPNRPITLQNMRAPLSSVIQPRALFAN